MDGVRQDCFKIIMKVIGVGIGRTGTLSLKVALETIGYHPCYHLLDVYKKPGILRILLAVGDGKELEWRDLFKHYRAGVDFPFTTQYKIYLQNYPETKVILTVRDPDEWYDSARQTIYHIQRILIRYLPGGRKVGEKTIWYQLFENRFEDREFAIRAFKQHTEQVKQTVAPEQLLIFNVKDGWEPLCAFLQVPLPDEPFPHANQRPIMRSMMALALILIIVLLIGVILLISTLIFLN